MKKGKEFHANDYVGMAIYAVIFIVVTLFLFVFKQECNGIDNEYLWCRLHPFRFEDIVGMALFYGCAASLAYLTFRPTGSASSSGPAWSIWLLHALGVILMFIR